MPVQVLPLTLKVLVKTVLEEKDLVLPASWLLFKASTDLPNPEIPSPLPFPLFMEGKLLSAHPLNPVVCF